MPTLRQTTIRAIHDQLDNSYFTIQDFNVQFPDDKKSLTVIRFNPEPGYQFHIDLNQSPHSAAERFVTTECPGRDLHSDVYKKQDIDSCINRIPGWCDRIKSEMRAATPIYDEIEELRQSFQSQIDEHLTDPDAHFTREEAEDLAAKLDVLSARFDDLQKKQSITEEQLDEIKEDIENIKIDATYFSKGAWYRTAGNKLLSGINRVITSKEGRSLAYEGVKRLLLGDGTGTPPTAS